MNLLDELDFKGSIATKKLREQHKDTVKITESYLQNKNLNDLLNHVEDLFKIHFEIEEKIVYPVFEKYLKNYLPYMEPIKMVLAEHNGVRNLYRKIKEGIDVENNAKTLAELLLQHVYKEENGVFNQVDKFVPDEEKLKISDQVDQFLKNIK